MIDKIVRFAFRVVLTTLWLAAAGFVGTFAWECFRFHSSRAAPSWWETLIYGPAIVAIAALVVVIFAAVLYAIWAIPDSVLDGTWE